MRRAALACALAIAACQKRPPPPCDDLRPMVDRMYDVEMRQVEGGLSAVDKRHAIAVAEQVAGPMKQAIVGACKDDGWPAEVVDCMKVARTEAALDECEARLTGDQRRRVEAAMREIVTRIQPPDDEPEDDGDTGIGESGVPACDDYARAMQRFFDCDGVSERAKTEARTSLAQLREGWKLLADPATPGATRQAAADACVQARAALGTSASAMGCDLAAAAAAAPAPAAAPADCAGLGTMVDGLLAEQLRDVPAAQRAHATALAAEISDPMKRALDERCTRDGWSAEATRCLAAARSGAALAACEAKLTPAQAQQLGAAMQDVTTRLTGSGAAVASSCDAYFAEVNALLACDAVPAAERATLQQRMAMVADGLHRLAGAVPASIAESCAKAQAAARARSQQLGCAR